MAPDEPEIDTKNAMGVSEVSGWCTPGTMCRHLKCGLGALRVPDGRT